MERNEAFVLGGKGSAKPGANYQQMGYGWGVEKRAVGLGNWMLVGWAALSRLGLGLVMGSVVVGAVVFPEPAGAGWTGRLTVDISGLRDRQGKICFRIFSGQRGFPAGKGEKEKIDVVREGCTAIANNPVLIVADLPYGNYAVALYHEKNGDGVLNRGLLGIPMEGFGFSNNPPIVSGPVRYQDAAFFLAGPTTHINVRMNYLK